MKSIKIRSGLIQINYSNYLSLLAILFCISCSSNITITGNRYNRSSNNTENTITDYNTEKHKGKYKIGVPYTVKGKTYYPEENNRYNEIGIASWYGDEFHNKKTANGDIFDMNSMTAAHKTLPMPSIVKITNLENGKSTKLVINDRGPFVDNRIIDVSRKAAMELGFINKGITKVKVEFLKKETEQFLKKYKLK